MVGNPPWQPDRGVVDALHNLGVCRQAGADTVGSRSLDRNDMSPRNNARRRGADYTNIMSRPRVGSARRLLEAIGLRFEKMIRISPDTPEDVRLYGTGDPRSANLPALE